MTPPRPLYGCDRDALRPAARIVSVAYLALIVSALVVAAKALGVIA